MFILFNNTSATMKLVHLFLRFLIEVLFASCLLLKLEMIYAIVCPRCLEHVNILSRLNGLHEKLDKTADVTWTLFFLNRSSDNLLSQPSVRSWSDRSVLEMFVQYISGVLFTFTKPYYGQCNIVSPILFPRNKYTSKNCSL